MRCATPTKIVLGDVSSSFCLALRSGKLKHPEIKSGCPPNLASSADVASWALGWAVAHCYHGTPNLGATDATGKSN